MTRNPRKTLPDIIRDNPSPFTRPVDTFAEAYPSVETFVLKITERPEKRETHGWNHSIGPSAWRHAVGCNNRACYGGGMEIGAWLHRLVREGVKHDKGTMGCEGHEGTKTKVRRACLTSFEYEIDIKYKPANTPAPKEEGR